MSIFALGYGAGEAKDVGCGRRWLTSALTEMCDYRSVPLVQGGNAFKRLWGRIFTRMAELLICRRWLRLLGERPTTENCLSKRWFTQNEMFHYHVLAYSLDQDDHQLTKFAHLWQTYVLC